MTFGDIISFLKEGRKYSFIIAASGSAVVLMRLFEIWPTTTLLDGLIGLLFVAAIMGWLALAFDAGEAIYVWLAAKRAVARQKMERETFLADAPERIAELTREEASALFWLLINERAFVEGAASDSHFRRLVSLGMLIPTADKHTHQILRVNPSVWEKREFLVGTVSPSFRERARRSRAPWDQYT